jgi:hypothetical protein
MKKFSNYLEVIQEVQKSGNSGNGDWEAVTDKGLVIDKKKLFDWSDLLDDFTDPNLKDEWEDITIQIKGSPVEGKIIKNYSNIGVNVFCKVEFYYQDTHKMKQR